MRAGDGEAERAPRSSVGRATRVEGRNTHLRLLHRRETGIEGVVKSQHDEGGSTHIGPERCAGIFAYHAVPTTCQALCAFTGDLAHGFSRRGRRHRPRHAQARGSVPCAARAELTHECVTRAGLETRLFRHP